MTVAPSSTSQPSANRPPPEVLTECIPPFVEHLYRWYVTAAILIMLTAGGSWGSWMLWQIGLSHQFTSVSIHAINAHGQAQIYGWMGLFIMGFGYHLLPRFWRATLVAPRLAPLVLLLVTLGVLLRTLGVVLLGLSSSAIPLALTGCVLQLLAICCFATQMLLTCRHGKTSFRPESGFILGAMAWFVLMGAFDTFHTWNTLAAPTPEALLHDITTYQGPLRDLQVHGLALFMILGISSRMIPAFYGRPVTPPLRGWCAFALLTTAVLAEVLLFIATQWTHIPRLADWLVLPWIMLAVGLFLQVWPWKLWRTPRRVDRSDKFIRIAYAWLALSLAMLLLLPLYQALAGLPLGHAYYGVAYIGAIRHAFTVGFVSLMIVGMSARFIPAIAGIPSRNLSRLLAPFLLINLGCFLRVSLQTLTDRYPAIYPLLGISSLFEIAGFVAWSFDILSIMWRSPKRRKSSRAPASVSPPIDHP